jgi:hypothetical protein
MCYALKRGGAIAYGAVGATGGTPVLRRVTSFLSYGQNPRRRASCPLHLKSYSFFLKQRARRSFYRAPRAAELRNRRNKGGKPRQSDLSTYSKRFFWAFSAISAVNSSW